MPFGIIAFIGLTDPGMGRYWGLGIGPREGVLLLWGTNLGRAIVTNGDFTAYMCDSAATRPSSQITLGRLVTTPVSLLETFHFQLPFPVPVVKYPVIFGFVAY